MIEDLSLNAIIEILQGVLGVLAGLWVAVLLAMRAPAYQRPAWAAVAILVVAQVGTLVYRLVLPVVQDTESDVFVTGLNVAVNGFWFACRLGVLALAVATAVAAARRTAPPLGFAPVRPRPRT